MTEFSINEEKESLCRFSMSSDEAVVLKMEIALTIYTKIYTNLSNGHIKTQKDLMDILRMMGSMLIDQSFVVEESKTFEEAKEHTVIFFKAMCDTAQKITRERKYGINS